MRYPEYTMTGSRLTLWLSLILALVQGAVYYAQLPDVVASHFDAAGQGGRLDGEAGVRGDGPGDPRRHLPLFLGVGAIRWPDQMVNLPHKEYWLAPQRREATWGQVRRYLDLLGAATLAFLLVVQQGVIEANLDAASRRLPADTFWWSFATYLAVVALLVAAMVRRFLRVPGGGDSLLAKGG